MALLTSVITLPINEADVTNLVTDLASKVGIPSREKRTSDTSATWSLSATPSFLQLYKNGLLLTEGDTFDYTLTGATVTFLDTLDSADILTAIYWQ